MQESYSIQYILPGYGFFSGQDYICLSFEKNSAPMPVGTGQCTKANTSFKGRAGRGGAGQGRVTFCHVFTNVNGLNCTFVTLTKKRDNYKCITCKLSISNNYWFWLSSVVSPHMCLVQTYKWIRNKN